ncbi:hypothetical protein AUJ14_05115 [Candidatus Micrarchaeota archaeon CG1_02_55_22]|nr:MAG: hypothetical protein AUJ14_05115 [Candidatus Micrarchaeota archaeon CG1_02_55_22]
MAFVRSKQVRGRTYYQLVESKLVNGKPVQRVIKHLGPEGKAKRFCADNGLQFPDTPTTASHDSFFTSPHQAAELVTALKGRQEIPLKFAYLEDGAENWRGVVESKEYGLGSTETELIAVNAAKIIGEVGKANIVDIGCGTGKKAVPFIAEMTRISQPKYVAFDISPAMLALAESNLVKKFPKLNTNFFSADFEQTNLAQEMLRLRENNFRRSLFLFLGNTVGNVVDKGRVLTNLRESMTFDDYLLLGIELFDLNRISKILSHYRDSAEVRRLLTGVLKRYGVEGDGRLDVSFNNEKSQVEIHLAPRRDADLTVSGKKIRLKEGEKVLLAVSYKGTPKRLQILLADTGFVIIHTYLSPEEDYALVLCKPARM